MIIKQAADVLKLEAEGILGLIDKLDKNFTDMINLVLSCNGRLIISGIGKSGLVGKKIVATLNSTGTRSMFLHPVEAMHGDLGIVSRNDIFLALSNSGETEELNFLLSSIREIGCKIVALTGNSRSTLAEQSDLVIDVGVDKEACPLGLAPTTSTTALLAMGDALAAVLINKKKFRSSDFKKNHPGGSLGQRLTANVKDIMLKNELIPSVHADASMEEAIRTIDTFKLGSTLVTDTDNKLVGIITDGDLRRVLAKKKNIFQMSLQDTMTKNPQTSHPDSPVYDAINIMEQYQITVLPITGSKNRICGILHLHDILGKGEFKINGQ